MNGKIPGAARIKFNLIIKINFEIWNLCVLLGFVARLKRAEPGEQA